MGVAILGGLLSTLKEGARKGEKQIPEHLPSRFIACVNRPESVEPLRRRVSSIATTSLGSVEVRSKDNLAAVQASDIVLLACQPSQAAAILSEAGMAASLANKLLLSICVGLSVPKIHQMIYGSTEDTTQSHCHIVHAMPNAASSVCQSATILSTGTTPLPPKLDSLTTWVFQSIGTVTRVPASAMNAASVAAASTLAFYVFALEGAAQGAIAEGVDEENAMRMVAQAMKGTAEMVLQGDHPAKIREAVTTPNGCTAQGVGVLEAASVQDVYSRAVKQAVERVFELGRHSGSHVS